MPKRRINASPATPISDNVIHASILPGYAAIMGFAASPLAVMGGYLLISASLVFSLRRPALPLISRRAVLWATTCTALIPILLALKADWQVSIAVQIHAHATLVVGLLGFLSGMKQRDRFQIVSLLSLMLFFISALFVRPAEFLPLIAIQTVLLVILAFKMTGGGGLRTFIPASLHTIAILAIGSALFITLPRLERTQRKPPVKEQFPNLQDESTGATGTGTTETTEIPETVGMPDRLDPMSMRSFRRLLENHTVALRVTLLGEDLDRKVSRPLYLRATTYDTYQNGAWNMPPAQRRLDDDFDGVRDGRIALRTPPPEYQDVVIQRIEPRPVIGRVLPAMPDAVRFRVPSVMTNNAGLYLLPPMAGVGRPYEVESLPPTFPEDRVAAAVGSSASPRYLQTPGGLDDVRAIARRLTDGAPTIMGKIDAVRDYLSTNFRYTLDAVDTTNLDPIQEFLAVRRTGYCVHFASAAALMLREAGVPARVAGGFLCRERPGDEWMFIARNSDAHLWAEVWFDGLGWMIVDPAPASRLENPDTDPNAREKLERQVPETRDGQGWEDPIAGFNSGERRRIFSGIGASFNGFAESLGEMLSTPWPYLIFAAVALLPFAVYLLVPSGVKSRVIAVFSGAPVHSTVPFYNRFLWMLYRSGIVRSPHQTPREFARSLPSNYPAADVNAVTIAFERIVYCRASLTGEEMREVQISLRRLEDSTRNVPLATLTRSSTALSVPPSRTPSSNRSRSAN